MAEISERIGVNVRTVATYLRGRSPSADFLATLARRGANTNWILLGEGSMTIDPADSATAPSLTHLSDRALMTEVDARFRATIEDGTKLLEEVRRTDLVPLGKKLKTIEDLSQLTPDEDALARKVLRALWTIERMNSWYPDLAPDQHEKLGEYLGVHERVTRDWTFRYIEWRYTGLKAIRHSTP